MTLYDVQAITMWFGRLVFNNEQTNTRTLLQALRLRL